VATLPGPLARSQDRGVVATPLICGSTSVGFGGQGLSSLLWRNQREVSNTSLSKTYFTFLWFFIHSLYWARVFPAVHLFKKRITTIPNEILEFSLTYRSISGITRNCAFMALIGNFGGFIWGFGDSLLTESLTTILTCIWLFLFLFSIVPDTFTNFHKYLEENNPRIWVFGLNNYKFSKRWMWSSLGYSEMSQ